MNATTEVSTDVLEDVFGEDTVIIQPIESDTAVMPITLRSITHEMQDLLSMIDDAREQGGEEAAASVSLALTEYLAANKEQAKIKVEAYCSVIRERELSAKFRKEEAKRLSELASADENTVKRMKASIFTFLESVDGNKIETKSFKVGLNRNPKDPLEVDKIYLDDPTRLPDKFKKITVEPDKTAIEQALKSGDDLTVLEIMDFNALIEMEYISHEGGVSVADEQRLKSIILGGDDLRRVEIYDHEAIPERFLTSQGLVDRVALDAAIRKIEAHNAEHPDKQQEDIPGVRMTKAPARLVQVAKFGPRGRYVSIR